MKDRYLILDFDGVFGDTLAIIDEYVQRIEMDASDKKGEEIRKRIRNLEDKIEEYDIEHAPGERIQNLKRQLKEAKEEQKRHFDLKDQVLEEVFEEYQNRIPYHDIITLKNMFKGVVKVINLMIKLRLYSKCYVVSHCNVDSEVNSKRKFLKENFGDNVVFVPVSFHKDSYFDEEGNKREHRERTNKIREFVEFLIYELKEKYPDKSDEEIKEIIKEIFINSAYIEDTYTIIEEALNEGIGYAYHRNSDNATSKLLIKEIKRLCQILNYSYEGSKTFYPKK